MWSSWVVWVGALLNISLTNTLGIKSQQVNLRTWNLIFSTNEFTIKLPDLFYCYLIPDHKIKYASSAVETLTYFCNKHIVTIWQTLKLLLTLPCDPLHLVPPGPSISRHPTEMERLSGLLPWSSLGTLKLAFTVSSDDWGSHPDNLSVSVSSMAVLGRLLVGLGASKSGIGGDFISILFDDHKALWLGLCQIWY